MLRVSGPKSKTLNPKRKTIMKGAEAVLKNASFMGRRILVKERIPKTYRIRELDNKLRRERTRQETKLLHRAKSIGVKCPTVLFVDEFSIGMIKLGGKRPEMNPKECKSAGEILAKLHNAGIIHGDFTPANLIKSGNKIYVIDFGLGFFSNDIEDKAVDVLTMLKSIENSHEFLRGYKKESRGFEKIMERMEEVKRRARYA